LVFDKLADRKLLLRPPKCSAEGEGNKYSFASLKCEYLVLRLNPRSFQSRRACSAPRNAGWSWRGGDWDRPSVWREENPESLNNTCNPKLQKKQTDSLCVMYWSIFLI